MQRTKSGERNMGDLEQTGSADIHQLYGVFNIVNRLGLHARPATVFVKTALRYDCDVAISRASDPKEVDGKSIMGVMGLEFLYGSEMRVRVSGNEDSGRCLENLRVLVASGFSEV